MAEASERFALGRNKDGFRAIVNVVFWEWRLSGGFLHDSIVNSRSLRTRMIFW